MFKVMDFRSFGGLARGVVLAPHVCRLAEQLANCLEPDGDAGITNESVFAWATYAENLIPLRLPLYTIWEHRSLSGDGKTIMHTTVEGAKLARQPGTIFRAAEIADLDLASVVWYGLQLANDPEAFLEPPPPLPTTPRNCAIAFALWRLDCALSNEISAEKMCETISMVGLMLAEVADECGRESGRISSSERAASARWERESSTTTRKAIYDEWKIWQTERHKYRFPRDFRRAMQLRFADVVDGTLKNWMSAWGQGRVES